MNIKRAFHRIITELDNNLPDGITKDNLFDAIDDIKASLILGEKLGKMYYILRDKIYTPGGTGISANIDKLETEFLGTSKLKTRKEKINDIMTKMRDLGVAKNDIITMLIDLRDEEEDV